jgi:hypothetical protein
MQGLMGASVKDYYSRSVSDEELADWSYEVADAMLAERKKGNDN